MNAIFKEKQVYPFWVVISIGIILSLSPIILIDFAAENSRSELYAALLTSAIILFVSFIFLLIKLKVRIDTIEIRYKFIPFIWAEKSINWNKVKKVEARKSKSIREFGGWGYRIGKGKRAFTLYGHWGLDITLENDKHIFIGTQKHCQLDAFLKDNIYPNYPAIKPTTEIPSDCP
jgi:hypothetical protein